MHQIQLEQFALKKFGIDIDRRKSLYTLKKEVRELLEIQNEE